MQLSKCQNNNNLFLYNGELVGLQFILKKIHEGVKLEDIQFVVPDENLNKALSEVVKNISKDVMNGVDKEEYPLSNLTLMPIEVDLSKEDIQMANEYEYEICNKEAKLKNFAKKLNGKTYQYPQFTKDELQYAKKNGIVILYGASDDLVEMDGVVCDEGGCFDGNTLFITPEGFSEEKGVQIDIFWCSKEKLTEMNEIITWTYEIKIPHETFMIYDEEEPYCKGLVFYAKDLEVTNE